MKVLLGLSPDLRPLEARMQAAFPVRLSRSGWVVFPFSFLRIVWLTLFDQLRQCSKKWEMRIKITVFVWQQRDFSEPMCSAWRGAQNSITLEQLHLSTKNICLYWLFAVWVRSRKIQLVATKCDSVYLNRWLEREYCFGERNSFPLRSKLSTSVGAHHSFLRNASEIFVLTKQNKQREANKMFPTIFLLHSRIANRVYEIKQKDNNFYAPHND